MDHMPKSITALFAGLAILVFCPSLSLAQMLEGRVEDDQALTRIQRENTSGPNNISTPDNYRIGRPVSDFSRQQGLVDENSFSQPLNANVNKYGAKLSLLRPTEFAISPSRGFDLDAEHGSRELTLAWERWHKQLSQAIYDRWSQEASQAGQATVQITVTRDRQITAHILNCTGGREFEASLMDSILSFNGNPGLTFPSGSERPSVTYEADYIAGHHVTPGYSWIKNDFEHVRENY